jgi:RNA polymerase sigma-70 factor (ECF subfamily)
VNSPGKDRFIEIINAHKGILLKVIRIYCRTVEDWKDLEQEIVIQLWKSFGRYDDQFKLSTWIYRVALNVAVSHYRKERKRQHDAALEDAILIMTDESWEEELQWRKSVLYELIDGLDKLNKALIILYLDEHSNKEIAEILGISESNVSTKLNRIKNQFKSICVNLN